MKLFVREFGPFLAFIGAVFLAAMLMYNVSTAIFAGMIVWVIYRGVGIFRWILTQMSWKHVAKQQPLAFEVRGREVVRTDGANPFLPFVDLLVPIRPRFRLSGKMSGRDIEIRNELTPSGNRTVWEADCSDFIPEWLELRPDRLAASSSKWLDVDDVSTGDESFDAHFLVRGADSDAVREFLWSNDVADTFADLEAERGLFYVEDGYLRLVQRRFARDSETVAAPLEELVEAAVRMRDAARRSRQHDERDARVDAHTDAEAVHVFE